MADLKALQKKIATLLYTQLSQYFNQVKILSYKPSADGKVSGKFIGDRRNYSFILANNQLQYLPSTRMDAALAPIPKGVNVQCSGSNHPCKGAKGTRCVPDSQSCKQREQSPEGIARLKEIGDTSRQITTIVASQSKGAVAKPNEKPSPEAPELNKDISLYDFLKYYSPWRPEGSKGFENAKRKVITKKSNTKPKPKPQSQTATQTESKVKEEAPKAQPKKEKATTPYDFLGINPKDFPNEAALYKAAKTAYRNLAAKYHPDKGGDPKMMTELNNVMDKLKRMRTDSARRRRA